MSRRPIVNCPHTRRLHYCKGMCRSCYTNARPTKKEDHRRTALKRYGLTIEDYDAMLEKQGGVCAICGNKPKIKRLHVDHDHKTEKVRGLLCVPCNKMLGFAEKEGWLESANQYVGYRLPVHHSRVLTGYLAGSIRDQHIEEDAGWREKVIKELNGLAFFINPLAGKSFNRTTKEWKLHNIPPLAPVIVAHDFYGIDESDFVIFNFKALSAKYPNIGTLVEFGRSTARGCLIYSIVDADYSGHDNTALFKLHPFIEFNSSVVFNTTDDCIEFLKGQLPVLSGRNPHFGGVIE